MPITADQLTALRTGRLASLEAWGSSLKPEDAATLANALKANGTLTTLDLGGNASLGDAGIRSLAPGLREARALSTLGLDGVGLGDGGGREVAAALRSNCLPALACLRLQHNSLTDATAVALADAVVTAAEAVKPRRAQLRKLLLHHNKVGERVLPRSRRLSKALASSSSTCGTIW